MKDQKPPPTHSRQEPGNHWHGNAAGLERALKKRVGAEVRFDSGSRALYAADSSNYRQIPIGVVVPKTIEQVVQTVALCREYSAPVLSRGGGTSLAGQCCNVAVVLDFSKYLYKILELNPEGKFARIQPGIVLDDLRAAAEQLHTVEVLLKALREGNLDNPLGKQKFPPHTVPEMQEQSQLKNRTRAEPMEV